jgi:hypothetical protein
MTDKLYDEIELEKRIAKSFGVELGIGKIVLGQVPSGRASTATVFLTENKLLFAYIQAQSPLVLSDVQKMVSHMGLVVESFIPPAGRPDYFDEVGKKKFLEMFPGRTNVSSDDIRFYRTMSPYNPALVQIKEVTDGKINQFDSDSDNNWRIAAKLTYRRIKTS